MSNYLPINYTRIVAVSKTGIKATTRLGDIWFPKKCTVVDTKNKTLLVPSWFLIKNGFIGRGNTT